VVVNEHEIVLGRLRLDRVDEASGERAEEVMEPGPATVRADADADRTTERLRSAASARSCVDTRRELLGLLRAGPP